MSVTHRHDNKNSCKTQADSDTKAYSETSIENYVESKVEIIISESGQQTEKTYTALWADKEGVVEDVELVKPCEDILLDVGDWSEVAAQDGTGEDAYKDAKDGQKSDGKLEWNGHCLKYKTIWYFTALLPSSLLPLH